MGLDIKVIDGKPELMAVIRTKSSHNDFSKKIPPLCGQVWNAIKKYGLKSDGHMVTIYHDVPAGAIARGEEVLIEVGARMTAKFNEVDGVVCTATPGGKLVTATHVGPYQKLGDTHRAIQRWLTDNKQKFTGTAWEVYDHPTPDESKLRTEIFYQLA